jgi:hypothetical protein
MNQFKSFSTGVSTKGGSYILIFFTLLQFGILLVYVINPITQKIVEVKDGSRLERSAVLSFGRDFYNSMMFIHHNTPGDAIVVIPPDEVDTVFGNEGLMQYFLFPRRITNCPTQSTLETCMNIFKDREAYMLIVGAYADALESSDDRYIPHGEDFGLYELNPG